MADHESDTDTASQSTNDSHLAKFENVRAGMNLSNLPSLVLSLRVRKASTNSSEKPQPLDCTLLPTPLFGSHHILFQLKFSDGITWLLKVPANGYPGAFDETSAHSLNSEAMTMRLLKRETTIPVPEIYHFSSSINNSLSVPYILMEYISGRPLYDVWFDRSIPFSVLEQRRCKTLRDVAESMVQMNRYVYSRGGSPLFNEQGNVSGIGPLRRVDVEAMLDRLELDDDGSAIFRTVGPFADAKSFFLSLYDLREKPEDDFGRGIYKLLRTFIDFALSESSPQKHNKEEEFVLSHPDLDIQNVIVSADDGSLRGLIDWDGVAAVPCCLGNERYPSWLTRDWDLMKYRYDASAVADETGHYENSPLELDHYREIYRKDIEDLLQQPSLSGKRTSNSLVLENLQIAADDPVCTFAIVETVCQKIKARLAVNKPSMRSQDGEYADEDGGGIEDRLWTADMAIALANGEMSETQLQQLKTGFLDLLS